MKICIGNEIEIKSIPLFTLSAKEIFSGNDEIIKQCDEEEKKIVNFWSELIYKYFKDEGIEIHEKNQFYTLTKGIENQNNVRFSSFIKEGNNYYAILHHEYNLEKEGENSISSLVNDWLFSFSKQEYEKQKGGENMELSDKQVEIIKQRYKSGMVVQLDYMDDIHAPAVGTKGIIDYVDDAGQIHVNWENGSGLSLVPQEDRFHIIKSYKELSIDKEQEELEMEI